MTKSIKFVVAVLLSLFALVSSDDVKIKKSSLLKLNIGVKKVPHKDDCLIKSRTGDILTVHFIGKLTDGRVFDDTRKKNEPFRFQLGAGVAIKGFEKGLIDMCATEIPKLFVPAHLGYVDRQTGIIPPWSNLIYEVELIKLEREPVTKYEGYKDRKDL